MFRLLIITILAVSNPIKDTESLKLNENNVSEIVDALTVEEKCMLIIGGRAEMFKPGAYRKIKAPGAAGVINEVPRLGIPGIVLADGPAGVRIRPKRPNDERTFYCTGFPIGSLVSSTWDTGLVEKAGAAMGKEARGQQSQGQSPCSRVPAERRSRVTNCTHTLQASHTHTPVSVFPQEDS